MPVRPLSDITVDFLKFSLVFTQCFILYLNIPVGEDYIVCISQHWTIVDRESGFKFLIPVPDNFIAVQCMATFNTHGIPTVGYPYCIVFDQDPLFMLLNLQSWAASKGIKLEPSSAYHPQMDS